MKRQAVTMVRLYLTEHYPIDALLRRLHEQEGVRGVTVFRAISGYGDSGVVHSARLVDLAMDLPVVVEFFDLPEKVEQIVAHLADSIKPGHLVMWPAEANDRS